MGGRSQGLAELGLGARGRCGAVEENREGAFGHQLASQGV